MPKPIIKNTSFESKLHEALFDEGLFDMFKRKKGAEDIKAELKKREVAELKAVAAAKSFIKYKQFKALFAKLKTDAAKEALNHEFMNFRYKNGHEPMHNSPGSLGGKVSAIHVPGREHSNGDWNESKRRQAKSIR